MTKLILDETELDVILDNGDAAFTVAASNGKDALLLTPVEEGNCWQISGAALKKLNRSGVNMVTLLLNGEEITLGT